MVAPWHLGTAHAQRDGVSEYLETSKDVLLQVTHAEQLSSIPDWEVDGLIAPIEEKNAATFLKAPFPVVGTSADPGLDIPFVDADPEACGVMAADYFLGLGHTQFATIYSSTTATHLLRARGFVNHLNAKGIQSVGELFLEHGELGCPEGEDRFLAWLRTLGKPTALFCTNDLLGVQILSLMGTADFFAPEDVSVLGCENECVLCEHVHPTLSSIQLPYKKIGFEAARMLDQLMQGKNPKHTHLLFPPERVVVRVSTSTLATPDPKLRKAFVYIQNHFDQPITVEQMATAAGISVRDLQRRFKTELGRSPKQELHLVRIKRVKELLRRTDLILSDIAEQTGFSSEYWMGAVFKNITGNSPGVYRKKRRLR